MATMSIEQGMLIVIVLSALFVPLWSVYSVSSVVLFLGQRH